MTKPTISPDDIHDLLERLLAHDVRVDAARRRVADAREDYALARDDLKDAETARDRLSWEIRNPPPLFDRPAPGKATTTAYDADVAAGVRAAEAKEADGYEWDLDGSLISPGAMPALTGPAGAKKTRGPRKAKEARA